MLTDKQHVRFLAKVCVNAVTGCHEWTAALDAGGYGRYQLDGKARRAHRVAYELYSGPIPSGDGYHGTCVLHTCDNPRCVRKEHLVLGSQLDNIADRDVKGRGVQLRGEAHPSTRLPDAALAQARNLRTAGWTQRAIAQAIGTTQAHVSRILNGVRRAI